VVQEEDQWQMKIMRTCKNIKKSFLIKNFNGLANFKKEIESKIEINLRF